MSIHPSQSKAPEIPVILGMHSGDALDVFIRDSKHQLHQAARITTRNGVDPLAMTTIMADLADAFGWRQIVAAPAEVPLSRELPRGSRVATKSTVAARRPNSHHRRTAAEMQQQEDTIRKYVNLFGRDGAVTTREVKTHTCATLNLNPQTTDSNIRHDLNELYEAGKIDRLIDPTVVSGGKPQHRWFGVGPGIITTEMVNEARASVALDGDTMS